ncbi:MAG: glycerophosphodiester phosphodiesterase [Firmicutes bacterium]|nr:glycerophosphodiester phosphodiesterase [Bacillota bacterium]
MRKNKNLLVVLVSISVFLFASLASAAEAPKVVIAHRAASGYLPEHTLPAVAMAYAFGTHFIEQDVALTKDGVFMVIHDIHLDSTTNVAEVFPGRHREDGHYYVVDFTLEEIKSLELNERVNVNTGEAVFPGRFPVGASRFEMPTLREEIEMIQGLNKSTGMNIGIYPEIKGSAFHHEEGFDIEQMLMDVLAEYGYTSKDSNVYIQCFEKESLLRLRELGCELPLVYLVYAPISPEEMDYIATFADGVGPYTGMIETNEGEPVDDYAVVRLAQERGLVVHPWTLRKDAMPPAFDSFEEMVYHFYYEIGVDGMFTDFPDLAMKVLEKGK